jgi:hypothetical protein
VDQFLPFYQSPTPDRNCHRPGGAHLTVKQRGKTRTVYVPKDLKEEVRVCIQENRRLRRLIQEITRLQLELIRTHRRTQARRAGRV